MDRPLRLLIVDDHDLSRTSVKMAFRFLGKTEITEAASGRDAVAKIEAALAAQTPFDLVVCDWVMPEFDGLQVLKWLKSHPLASTTPFVMCTAEKEMSAVTLAVKEGASGYIIKPIVTEDFRKKIAPILRRIGFERLIESPS